jgi:hypothetical protein
MREGAGCFGYGENKQKGDNEGGLKPRPASSTRFGSIITNQGKKTSLFKNFFIYLPNNRGDDIIFWMKKDSFLIAVGYWQINAKN